MKYKGCRARVDFDERDNILIGRLIDVADDVSFHAENVSDLRKAFELSVDDYLEYCEKTGKSPTRSLSGKVALRLTPEIHKGAVTAAKSAGVSLNKRLVSVIDRAMKQGS